MIVVADTGPVNYLVLSGQVELAHDLYGTLLIPPAVCRELRDPSAPAAVRQWVATLPAWAEERSPKDASRFSELGPGEREAIALALETKADLLLIDETQGRKTAVENGVPVKGTLGLLEEADARRLVDFPQALASSKPPRFSFQKKSCRPRLSVTMTGIALDESRSMQLTSADPGVKSIGVASKASGSHLVIWTIGSKSRSSARTMRPLERDNSHRQDRFFSLIVRNQIGV